MTATRARVLAAIRDLTAQHRIPPTLREIGDAVGLCVSTVDYHVRELARAGAVTRQPGKSRSITITNPEGDHHVQQ